MKKENSKLTLLNFAKAAAKEPTLWIIVLAGLTGVALATYNDKQPDPRTQILSAQDLSYKN